jgi:hypothetical protein
MVIKRSIAAVAVTAAIMTGGLVSAAPAFAATGGHAAQVSMAETSTINKFVDGRYLIIVRYVKDDPLPKQFAMPMTLRAGEQQDATSGQLTTLQRSYQSLARGSIQVFMLKAVTHVQRHWLHPHWHWHWHAHINTGFGGEARIVARNLPYTSERR